MTVRPERPSDYAAVRAVVAAAFRGAGHAAPPLDATGDPGEAVLVEWLRSDAGYLPELALVAELDGSVVGHVLCTRAWLAPEDPGSPDIPVLGLGPLAVSPDHQGHGIGSRLLKEVVKAATGEDERLIALLGDPGFYGQRGWEPASRHGIAAPEPEWEDFFQVRLLPADDGARGRFRYAAPFARLE
ncbi:MULTISPECIES: N-acetyltransferase [Arthrobacter]|uniref:N-acetyltransferase n=2 Tax=Arthrobacter TaxID=1663 RepID=A0ABU9KGG6_9MICC|nr:N-acetyltransferase [Arthrobacter sp. YJM1]MDP5225980.1 N-acetyltransferase [Arthrobacter sp. YJM1]